MRYKLGLYGDLSSGHFARMITSATRVLRRAASTAALPGGLGCRAREGTALGEDAFALEYFDESTGEPRSPWHDVPVRAEGYAAGSGVLNFVNEIPRFTTAKMEIDTKAPHNPIVQDRKNGALRHYHGPLYWNYGCIAQTWEDPCAAMQKRSVDATMTP